MCKVVSGKKSEEPKYEKPMSCFLSPGVEMILFGQMGPKGLALCRKGDEKSVFMVQMAPKISVVLFEWAQKFKFYVRERRSLSLAEIGTKFHFLLKWARFLIIV